MDFSVEAFPYRDNHDLQENIVKCVSMTTTYSDSLDKVMSGYMTTQKTVVGIVSKLNSLEGYNVFTNDNGVCLKFSYSYPLYFSVLEFYFYI